MSDIPKDLGFAIDRQKLALLSEPRRIFEDKRVEDQYVAFLDVLGFSNRVKSRFDLALASYQALIDGMRVHEAIKAPDTQMQIVSDSIVLVSGKFRSIVQATQMVLQTMLQQDCLVRGGIGYGRHIDVKDGGNTYIVSEALIEAVSVEKNIKFPCVALHRDIQIPDGWWRPDMPAIMKTVVHFQGMNIVSPLSLFWGSSALDRAIHLRTENSEHADKYDWFIGLCEAVLRGDRLVPSAVGDPDPPG